ncbi:MAG: EF-hand domain-containing protein [Alphaproteobacteria bacterium]
MLNSKFAALAASALAVMLIGSTGANAQMGGGGPPVLPPNMVFSGPNAVFGTMDTNKDNAVSKQEYLDYYSKRFDSIDKNKDGKITADEMPTKNKGKPNTLFNEIDTNKDGVVTKQEYLDYYAKKFDAADKNKDGKIMTDELQKQTN